MLEKEIAYHSFKNIGYVLAKLTEEDLKPIIKEVKEIQSNFNKGTKVNNKLAGNIKYEFTLDKCKDHVASLISPIINAYESKAKLIEEDININKDRPIKLALHKLWVNFMRKTEFNPPHIHSGIYSFVLWLDIPYCIKDEMERLESKDSAFNCPGHFIFQYVDVLGTINSERIPVDKSWNGTLCVFPSSIVHSVMPFYTSDNFRITISGNLEQEF